MALHTLLLAVEVDLVTWCTGHLEYIGFMNCADLPSTDKINYFKESHCTTTEIREIFDYWEVIKLTM